MNNKNRRVVYLILIDYLIFLISYGLALLIRFQTDFAEMEKYIYPSLLYPVISVIIFKINNIYKSIWRFATLKELSPIFYSSIFGFMANIFIFVFIQRYLFEFVILPFSVAAITSLMGTFLVILSRVIWFSKANTPVNNNEINYNKNLLIIGAGDAGTELLGEYLRNPSQGIVKGFLDDDSSKISRNIRGVKVLGSIDNVDYYVKNYDIDEIIIALPSANSNQMKKILEKLKNIKIKVKTLPPIIEIINNKLSLGALREVNISDLLGRKEVEVNVEEIRDYIANKKILITGAGGSIGSEICRQVASVNPKIIYLLGRGENSIFSINKDLKMNYPEIETVNIICDVTNEKRINHIFKTLDIDVVFHAAAHKHVPLMEENPTEAFRVNSIGTYNVAKAAGENKIDRFIYISTDKAINPTSVMGVSKRLGEIIIQSISYKYTSKFGMVRFGNVLGSRGSVVPIFKEQIKNGGPVTVTHPEMKRYFMTIPEAVSLVLQCGKYSRDGEIFLLDMGEPVKIVDLAKELIRLSGLIPEQDIKIEFTGIRKGEKLYEELIHKSEEKLRTPNKRIIMLKNKKILNEGSLETLLELLYQGIEFNNLELLDAIIKKHVPEAKVKIQN
jgi:FlaA1/EpsC-like NDP-sugar epimerase